MISQDTSAYGVDVRYRTGFWQGRPVKTRMTELARELDALARTRGAWVRLHYVYPYPHVDEVISLMADDLSGGGLVPYLDIPFQHASPRILKLMKRPAAPEKVLDRVRAWRAAKPDLAIRSTFIVGFPGETDAEFEELHRLPRGGAARPGRLLRLLAGRRGRRRTRCPTRCAPEIREARRLRFMDVQSRISAAKLAAKVGRTLDVLVDGTETVGRGRAKRRSPSRAAARTRRRSTASCTSRTVASCSRERSCA